MARLIATIGLLSTMAIVLLPAPAETACIFKHTFVSTQPTGTDTSVIRPPDWNDCHTAAGGTNGQFFIVDTSDATYRTGFSAGLSYANNQLLLPEGSVSAPALAFASQVGMGFARLATNVWALMNGASGVNVHFMGTFTDISNFESLRISTGPTTESIYSINAGTGVARELQFGTLGAAPITFRTTNVLRWTMDANPGHWVPGADNAQDLGAATGRLRHLYAGTSVQLGTNPATVGDIRFAHGNTMVGRDSANSANHTLLSWGSVGSNELVFGGGGVPARIRTNLSTPGTLGNGDWWVECSGTSPSRVCAIKVQDGGVTRTIASITF